MIIFVCPTSAAQRTGIICNITPTVHGRNWGGGGDQKRRGGGVKRTQMRVYSSTTVQGAYLRLYISSLKAWFSNIHSFFHLRFSITER
jgi:hypothetical protein